MFAAIVLTGPFKNGGQMEQGVAYDHTAAGWQGCAGGMRWLPLRAYGLTHFRKFIQGSAHLIKHLLHAKPLRAEAHRFLPQGFPFHRREFRGQSPGPGHPVGRAAQVSGLPSQEAEKRVSSRRTRPAHS